MKLLSILSVAAPLLLDTSLAAVPAKKQPTAELETTQWFIPQSEPLLLARSMRRKIFGSARAASPGGSDLNKNKGSISHPPTNDKKETQPKKEVAPQKTDKTGPTTNAQKKTEEKKAVAQQPKKAVAQQSKKAVAEHPQQAQHAAKPAKPAKQNIKDGGGSKSSSSSGSPKAKGSSKNSKSKDSPKTPTAKNTSKTPKAKDSVKNSKAKDNPKHSGPKDSSKISKIKESPKTAKAKDSLKNSKTKDDLKKSKAKDSPKTPKAKDSPQTPKAKDSSKTLKAKGSPKPEASKAKSNKAKTLNGSSPKSPKTPGAPPRIVDTTRKSEYERLRPKPGGKQPEKGSNDGKASPAHKSGKSVNKDGRKADRKTDKKVSGDKGGKGSTQAKSPAQKGEKEKATRKTQDEARRLHIKNLLKDPKHKPKRPDADWRPPKPDPRPGSAEATMHKGKPAYHLPEASKKAGTAPYHPNDKSSGEIKVPKRKKQYSKGSGSPQKDPGFIRYTNSKDPHDRSYVRKEAFKDKDGKTRVAATSVYDARNMSYHAVNKLHGLEANPDYTYAEIKGENHRDVTDNARQTYDPNRTNAKDRPLANPRDEFPHATTTVKDEGKDREAKTNVALAPDRESRAEGYLRTSTRAEAIRLAREAEQKEIWTGTAVMDGHRLKFDHGDGKWGPYSLDSAKSPSSPEAAPAPDPRGKGEEKKRSKKGKRELLRRELEDGLMRWMRRREAERIVEERVLVAKGLEAWEFGGMSAVAVM